MSAKPAILVVDDNPDAREIIVLFLKGVGFQAIEAATGPEARRASETDHPDLILFDLALPELAGDEVAARLNANPKTRNIPIIVLTALVKEDQIVKRALECGAEEMLIKPYSFEQLGEAIRRYVHQPHDPRF